MKIKNIHKEPENEKYTVTRTLNTIIYHKTPIHSLFPALTILLWIFHACFLLLSSKKHGYLIINFILPVSSYLNHL